MKFLEYNEVGERKIMIYYRTYKYLIKPTSIQKEKIHRVFSCCTYVYNKFVKENGVEKYKGCMAKDVISRYRDENELLNDVDVSALFNLMFVLLDPKRNQKFIKTKKHSFKSYTTSNLKGRQAICLLGKELINIPYLGAVKIVLHRQIPEDFSIKTATITMDNLDSYYVCIAGSFNRNNKINEIDINNSIGFDYSSQHLYVDSEGRKCDMRHFLQENEEQLSKLKLSLSKCRRGSINYYKIKDKIGKIYKRTVDQRNDFLHKKTTELAKKYDLVCVEDLNMNEIAGRFSLAKNTYDNSYGKFLDLLKYKLEENNKVFIKVDKYFPSSKTCNVCGYVLNDLPLSKREWTCPRCQTKHDRDINAAINIRNRGIEKFKSIGYLDYALKKGSIPH